MSTTKEHHVTSLRDLTRTLCSEPAYAREGHTARSLVHAPDLRVLLVAMRAGATMAEHAAATSVTVNVVSGALQMKVRGETIDLAEAHFVRIEPGERHDVVATTDAAFVLTLGHTASGTAPSPVMDVPPCE